MIQLEQITIVYPESSEMESLARSLARKMKHYSISRSLSDRIGARSVRDLTESWLIVLCTPDTPKDPKVNQVIDDFISRGLFGHILTLLVDGLPEDSFPESLVHEQLEDGTIVDHEPLAANISGLSGSARARKLKTEKLRLLAPILGVSFDELLNRRARRQKRIIAAIGAAVLALGAAFLVIMFQRTQTFKEQADQLNRQLRRAEVALEDVEQARDETAHSIAGALSTGAADVLRSGDCELAMLLCLSLLPEYSDIQELTDTLKEALRMRGAAGYVPLTAADGGPANTAPGSSFDADEDAYAMEAGSNAPADTYGRQTLWKTDQATGKTLIFDKKTDELITILPFEYSADWGQGFSSEGYLLYVSGESEVRVYDPAQGQVIRSFEALTYPLYSRDVSFAGEIDEATNLPGADIIKCGDLLFKYQEQEVPVPADLTAQMALAQEYLGGRVLTEAERSYYEIDLK